MKTDDEINAMSEDERRAYRRPIYRPVTDFLLEHTCCSEAAIENWLAMDTKWFGDYCLGLNMEEMRQLYLRDRA